jgi:hypothetical protein
LTCSLTSLTGSVVAVGKVDIWAYMHSTQQTYAEHNVVTRHTSHVTRCRETCDHGACRERVGGGWMCECEADWQV